MIRPLSCVRFNSTKKGTGTLTGVHRDGIGRFGMGMKDSLSGRQAVTDPFRPRPTKTELREQAVEAVASYSGPL
jgi:hypothetical protein